MLFRSQIFFLIDGKYECALKIVEKKEFSSQQITQQAPSKNIDIIEYKRTVNRLDAATALPPTHCSIQSGISLQRITCNVAELPYRLMSFLIRPIIIKDSGSSSNNLAATENVFWVVMILLFVAGAYLGIRSSKLRPISVSAFVFASTYSALASLYEGNLGTAFRHKSSILWCLLLIIGIGFGTLLEGKKVIDDEKELT